jgi:putative DNA primase/helicase
MIVEGGHHIFWGVTGLKKSFLVMDLALRLANGMDYYGMKTTPCEVVYVVGEGQAEFDKRQDAWLKYHGKSNKLYAVMDPLYFQEQERFKAFIDGVSHLGAALVVIDTLADSASGVKIIDNDEYNKFVKPLRKAINVQAGAATIFVHHSGHNADRETGASMIRNDAEASFRVGASGTLTTLARKKTRGADDSNKEDFLFLRAVKAGKTVVLDSADEISIATAKNAAKTERKIKARQGRKKPKNDMQVEVALLKAFPSSLTVDTLVQTTGVNESSVRNALTRLKDRGKASNNRGEWTAINAA